MNISDIQRSLEVFLKNSQLYLYPWLLTLGAIWGFNIINWVFRSRFNRWGILPRRLIGLRGIVFSPFLHEDFNHLFFNAIPLFVLGLALLGKGLTAFYWATFLIITVSGFLVWLLGRRSIHIGASGLVSGYFAHIIAMAYFEPGFMTFLIALLALYYFGGIFLGIFPSADRTSWESHLFGFLSGIASFYLLPWIGKSGILNLLWALKRLSF